MKEIELTKRAIEELERVKKKRITKTKVKALPESLGEMLKVEA